jgi:hypothetical protein
MTVSPKACSMVTGNDSDVPDAFPPEPVEPPFAGPVEQAERERAVTAAAARKERARMGAMKRLLDF